MLCNKLQHIEFPEKSELTTMGKQAFTKTKIEKIFIPKGTVDPLNKRYKNYEEIFITFITKRIMTFLSFVDVMLQK